MSQDTQRDAHRATSSTTAQRSLLRTNAPPVFALASTNSNRSTVSGPGFASRMPTLYHAGPLLSSRATSFSRNGSVTAPEAPATRGESSFQVRTIHAPALRSTAVLTAAPITSVVPTLRASSGVSRCMHNPDSADDSAPPQTTPLHSVAVAEPSAHTPASPTPRAAEAMTRACNQDASQEVSPSSSPQQDCGASPQPHEGDMGTRKPPQAHRGRRRRRARSVPTNLQRLCRPRSDDEWSDSDEAPRSVAPGRGAGPGSRGSAAAAAVGDVGGGVRVVSVEAFQSHPVTGKPHTFDRSPPEQTGFANESQTHNLISMLPSASEHYVHIPDVEGNRTGSNNPSEEQPSQLARSRTSRSTPLELDSWHAERAMPTPIATHIAVATPLLAHSTSPEPPLAQRPSPRPTGPLIGNSPHDAAAGSLSEGTRSYRSRSDTFLMSHSSASLNSARLVPSFFRASLVAAMSEGPDELAVVLDQPMTAATYSLHHTRDSYDSARSIGGGSHYGGSLSGRASSSGSSLFISHMLRVGGGETGEDAARADEHTGGSPDKRSAAGADLLEDLPPTMRQAALTGVRIRSTKELPPVPTDVSTANGLDVKRLRRLHRRTRESPVEHQSRVYRRVLVDPDTQQRFHVLNEKYVVYPQEIGRGSFSKVKLAYSLEDECFYAMKIMNRHRLHRMFIGDGASAAAAPNQEANLLAALRHRNIVALREFLNDPGMRHVLFVLELAEGGEVMSVRDDGSIIPFDDGLTSYPEAQSQRIVYGIVNALMFAHKMGVAHRDVKPANVLVTAEGEVKLSDFGVSALVEEDRLTKLLRQGSVAFLAPEVLLTQEVVAAPRSLSSSTWTSTFTASRPLTGSERTSTHGDGAGTTVTTTSLHPARTPAPRDVHEDDSRSASEPISILLTSHSQPSVVRQMVSEGSESFGVVTAGADASETSELISVAGADGLTGPTSVSSRRRSGAAPIGKPPLNASRRTPMNPFCHWNSLNSSQRALLANRTHSGSFGWHTNATSLSGRGGLYSTNDCLTADSHSCDEFIPPVFDMFSTTDLYDENGTPIVDLFKVDTFAIGVTAFALLMGRLPWIALDAMHQFTAMCAAPDPFLSAYQKAYGPNYTGPQSYQSYYAAPSFPAFGQHPLRPGRTSSSGGSSSSAAASTAHTNAVNPELPPPVPLSMRTAGTKSMSSYSPWLASRSNSTPSSADRNAPASQCGISSEDSKSYSSQNVIAQAVSHSSGGGGLYAPSVTHQSSSVLMSTLNFTLSNSAWLEGVDQKNAMPSETACDGPATRHQPGLPVWRSQLPHEAAAPLPVTSAPTAPSPKSDSQNSSSVPSTQKFPSASDVRATLVAHGPSTASATATDVFTHLIEAQQTGTGILASSLHTGPSHSTPELYANRSRKASAATVQDSDTDLADATVTATFVEPQAASQSSLSSVEGMLRERINSNSSRENFESDSMEHEQLLDGVLRRPFVVEETLDLPADATHAAISALAVDFVRACLHPDPAQRRTVFELFEHPWIQQVVEDTRKLHESENGSNTTDSASSDDDSDAQSFLRDSSSDEEEKSHLPLAAEPASSKTGQPLSAAATMPSAPRPRTLHVNSQLLTHPEVKTQPSHLYGAPLEDSYCPPVSPGDDDNGRASSVSLLDDHVTDVSLPAHRGSGQFPRSVVATGGSGGSSTDGAFAHRADWLVSGTDEPDTEDAHSTESPSLYDSTLTTGGHPQSSLLSPLTAQSLGASTNPDFLMSLNATARTMNSGVFTRNRHGSLTVSVSHAHEALMSPCTVSNSSLGVTVNSSAPHESRLTHAVLHGAASAVSSSPPCSTRPSQRLQLSSSASHGAETEDRVSHTAQSLPSTECTLAAEDAQRIPIAFSPSLSSASEGHTPEMLFPHAFNAFLARSPLLGSAQRPVSAAMRHFLGYTDDEDVHTPSSRPDSTALRHHDSQSSSS